MTEEVVRQGKTNFELVDFAYLTEDQRALDKALR